MSLIDIIATQPPMDPDSLDEQSGNQVQRFGPPSAGAWRLAKLVEPGAGESLPTKKLQCIVETKHPRIEWLVLPPATGVTDYDVVIGRWISGKAGSLVLARFVSTADLNGNGAGPLIEPQVRERDPFMLVIDSVTGAGTAPPSGITRPGNLTAIPNGAFAVLWRPATLNPGS